jgi:hypothetical protein
MAQRIHSNSASDYDADLDELYAWMPPDAPAPAPLPEAAFSLTLKGRVGGVDALLTVRGMTSADFHANLAAVRGLMDVPPPPPQGQDAGWCAKHQTAMQRNDKHGRQWYSHKVQDGWCKGKLCRESGK